MGTRRTTSITRGYSCAHWHHGNRRYCVWARQTPCKQYGELVQSARQSGCAYSDWLELDAFAHKVEEPLSALLFSEKCRIWAAVAEA